MTTLGIVYRSTARPCRWCRLAIVSEGAGGYCSRCQPLRDIALRHVDAARDEALSYLVDPPEPEVQP